MSYTAPFPISSFLDVDGKTLTKKQKASAIASAKKAGRPYPNLVDNMRAARKK